MNIVPTKLSFKLRKMAYVLFVENGKMNVIVNKWVDRKEGGMNIVQRIMAIL